MANRTETTTPASLQGADEDVLLESLRTHPTAFSVLYHKYLRRVYRYLLFQVGDRLEAEDLTSQVFLAAWEGLPGYHHRGHFAAWLFAIARRKAADHHRRRRPLPLPAFSEAQPDGVDLLGQVIADDELKRLAELVSDLKEKEQELLRLRFAAELGFDEMAALLRRSPAAVKMSLYRLLRRLERQIEESQEHDGSVE
jgi:RNA polymerase sigma-70 factor (ECF subfamily)